MLLQINIYETFEYFLNYYAHAHIMFLTDTLNNKSKKSCNNAMFM